MKIKKVGSKSTYLIIIGVIIIIIGLVFYFDKKNNTENTMPIATILMSLAATITFLYTIEKNKESKEQFKQERNEVKAQFEEQQKFFQKQQFESTFFNMMKQLEDIINNLSFHNVKGREIFTYFYLTSRQVVDNIELVNIAKHLYPLNTFIDETQASRNDNLFICIFKGKEQLVSYEGVSSLIRLFGIFGFESSYSVVYLDFYFRFIYRILKFVDESNFIEDDPRYIDERYKYTSLLRAVLSPSELYFIYYDGLTNKGIEKFKPLIEKYSILKNFMIDMTENSKFDKALNPITDIYEKDYYRYKSNIKKENQVKELIPTYYYTAFEKDQSAFKNKN
jgi:hypothetical protein